LGVTSRGEDEKDWRATMVRFESVGEVIVMYRLIGGLEVVKSYALRSSWFKLCSLIAQSNWSDQRRKRFDFDWEHTMQRIAENDDEFLLTFQLHIRPFR